MDRIPGQLGYLQLNEDGAVFASSGDLENDENTANIILNLLTMTNCVDKKAFNTEQDGFKKLTITYSDHCYIVCISNRRIHIVKKSIDNIVV